MTQTRDNNAPHDVDRTRTCIATRTRKPEGQLLRMVAHLDDGAPRILPDPRRRLPGRGAWITPTLDAWAIAEKRCAFGRALKVSANADANPVREYLESLAASTPPPSATVTGTRPNGKT